MTELALAGISRQGYGNDQKGRGQVLTLATSLELTGQEGSDGAG